MPRHLLPLDGSPLAERAIPHAVAVGRALGATTILLRVLETDARHQEAVDSVSWSLERAEAAAYLGAWRTRLERAGAAPEIDVREGRAAEQIVECAHDRGADLVVVCAHGRGGDAEFGVGGTAQKLIAWGGASILVVRPDGPGEDAALPARRYGRILVPVDGSRRGEWALSTAASLARELGGSLVIARVVLLPEWRGGLPAAPEDARLTEQVVVRSRAAALAYLEEAKARLAPTPVAVTTRLVEAASAGRAIAGLAREEGADLVVVAAHGAGCPEARYAWPYGSVATSLLAMDAPSLLVLQDLPRREVTTPAAEAALAGCGRALPR